MFCFISYLNYHQCQANISFMRELDVNRLIYTLYIFQQLHSYGYHIVNDRYLIPWASSFTSSTNVPGLALPVARDYYCAAARTYRDIIGVMAKWLCRCSSPSLIRSSMSYHGRRIHRIINAAYQQIRVTISIM